MVVYVEREHAKTIINLKVIVCNAAVCGCSHRQFQKDGANPFAVAHLTLLLKRSGERTEEVGT